MGLRSPISWMENKSGSKGKAATPFMMATGLLMDEDIFKNVTVENGRLISDGERNMVIGYGLPAMKDILGIEEKDLDLPDYVEIEADVTEYEPVEGMTIATNSIFNDLDRSVGQRRRRAAGRNK